MSRTSLFIYPFLDVIKIKIPIISRILHPRTGYKNKFWCSTYSVLIGSIISGKIINERTAMQTTAVYACVRILAETIASLPLHTYKYTENGKEKDTEYIIFLQMN